MRAAVPGVGVAALRHRHAGRHVQPLRAVGHRVGDDEAGAADAVDRAVGVQVGVALVGGDLVVDHRDGVAPAPHRQHQVAFLPLRAGRRRRDLAGRDAVGPVGEQAQRALAPHAVEPGVHARAATPHLHPVVPRVEGRVEVVDVQHGHLAGGHVAHLVAELTAVLQPVDPLGLVPHGPADAVAVRAGARELARRRHLEQRVPVVGGVDARRLLRGGRRGHRQGHLVPGPRRLLPGVDEAVAAHPELVAGVRQVGHEKPAVVAGDDDLAERGLEVAGLGDHPYPGLAAAGAPHDAADVLVGRRRAAAGQQQDDAGQEQSPRESDPRCHAHVDLLEQPGPRRWRTVYVAVRESGTVDVVRAARNTELRLRCPARWRRGETSRCTESRGAASGPKGAVGGERRGRRALVGGERPGRRAPVPHRGRRGRLLGVLTAHVQRGPAGCIAARMRG